MANSMLVCLKNQPSGYSFYWYRKPKHCLCIDCQFCVFNHLAFYPKEEKKHLVFYRFGALLLTDNACFRFAFF